MKCLNYTSIIIGNPLQLFPTLKIKNMIIKSR